MKKIILPKFSKIAFIISGVLLCIYILIRSLAKFDICIYFLGVGTQESMPFITMPCVAFTISAVAVLLYKNIGHKTLVTSLTIVISFLILSYMLIDYAFAPSSKYFEYTSDDKNHQIVVNECSFLLGGWGDIYEKTSFCTMKKVGDYTTDDGFCPFTNSAFFFVWNENDFELHYDDLSTSSEKYRVVKMEYAK